MEIAFDDEALDRLETDPDFSAGFADSVVRAYRKRLQQIRAAPDERTFYTLKSLHFEKLQGDRDGQRSVKLNDQWRLVLCIEGQAPNKVARLIGIVDYH